MEIKNNLTVTRRERRGMTGKEGEGSSQGTCIKDPWTKTRGVLNVGSGEWGGEGRVMRGKWGQL